MKTFKPLLTRRELLKSCAAGFGYMAFSSLFADIARAATNPLVPHAPHFAPKAKRVIFLFMHGGPSHVDTFDYKPLLTRDHGKTLPESMVKSLNADPNAKLLGSPWAFPKRGQSGLEISELFPEVASCADDLCLLRSMYTDGQDHGRATVELHTGHQTQIRPSLGAWVIYGLGSESQNLPGFITISPSNILGGSQCYGSAFLPAVFQGTPVGRPGATLTDAQIRHIRNGELSSAQQRRQLDFIQQINRREQSESGGNAQIEGVIQSAELAFRMQTEAPETMDLTGESKATLDLYGVDQAPTDTFARQCLMARRFAEKGVRFVQVSHTFKWDQHVNLKRDHDRNAREVDKPIAGLLKDLKTRGLLQDTLVLWGGEFGRTPAGQGTDGRDHNPRGFAMWMAGGGAKPGFSYGATDDYGFAAQTDRMHINDLHATMLNLLGFDHEKLTFRHGGRDYRLTDVSGKVAKAVIAGT